MIAKNKLSFFGILAVLLLSLGFASAASFTITNVTYPSSIAEGSTLTFTYNVTYTGVSEDMNISFANSTASIGTISVENATGLNGSIDEFVLLEGTVTDLDGHGGETLEVVINGTSDGGSQENYTFSVPITEVETYCDEGTDFSGEAGDLEITDFNIEYDGVGDEDDWEVLDSVIIEVDVKNTNTDDHVNDIYVQIRILDDEGSDVTSEFEFEDEDDRLGRIDKKDTETATFEIKELPIDLEEGDYKIYVRAYEQDNESSNCISESDELNGDQYHSFDVSKEDEAVVLKESDLLEKVLASCGDKNVEVSFKVYNTGEDKEKKVLVNLYNSALGINQNYVIDSLRSGKSKTATFYIDLPEKLSEKTYNLDIMTYFSYDDDDDEDENEITSYDADSDDVDGDYSLRLEILSCTGIEPQISANLQSEAIEGQELVIKTTDKNNGAEASDFTITTSEVANWAEVLSIEPSTFSLEAGETKEIVITMMPSVGGLQTFKVNAVSDGQTYEQLISVSIEEKKGWFNGVSKTTMYLTIAIAIVLILIFVTLASKVSRRQNKPKF